MIPTAVLSLLFTGFAGMCTAFTALAIFFILEMGNKTKHARSKSIIVSSAIYLGMVVLSLMIPEISTTMFTSAGALVGIGILGYLYKAN